MVEMPSIGSQIAGYRIERQVGRGGMGVVFLAEHVRLGRKAALKLLAPDLEDERFRERFVRESQLAATLDHPNIVPVYDAGEVDGLLYIAMRFVDGTDLGALTHREGKLDPHRTFDMLAQIGNALDSAHAEGLVHRDVKPANILVLARRGSDGRDQVFLTDFGLTKHADSTSGLTRTGQFIGTIDYIAPEQIEGKDVDGRADLYSLGCVAYQCLTGSVPYDKDNEVATMYAHLREDPPHLRDARPDLPEALDAVLAKAMAKDRDDRYDSCAEMIAAARAALPAGGPAETAVSAAPTIARSAPLAAPGAGATGAKAVPTVAHTETAPDTGATGPAQAPGAESAPAGQRGKGIWLVAAAVVALALIAGGVVVLTRDRTPTPGPQDPVTQSPTQVTDQGELVAYLSAVDGTLAQSTQARATINDALGDAMSSDAQRRQDAPGGLQTAIDQRQQQVTLLRGLDAPAGTEHATRLLIASLIAAIQSDELYLKSAEAAAAGDAATQSANLAAAETHDHTVVEPLKRKFVRAYNELRVQAGLPELPEEPAY